MKEIKFRIFDNSEKKFLIKNEKVSRGIFKDKVSEIVDFENNSVQINNPEDERYIFLQYTGMKDINDKEIYEGDIVLWIDSYDNERKDKVFFENGAFRINSPLFEIADYGELEIIGNFYQNPELLEEK
ncbi:YopX family protein [Fusobacterium necrophorum]|uniref:YopX protein domain-containing protein n=1 Tax=Fusobacterium necrophorum subsp. funduliforme TaxID=143387 RepID=A0A162J1P6_9FUSO|nr:YopX family protein [Fusobacterium necrophorum]KYL04881.1 hypothetical protein A2J07_09785 [Fusobacterium necrophorum subsp. funduliforme]